MLSVAVPHVSPEPRRYLCQEQSLFVVLYHYKFIIKFNVEAFSSEKRMISLGRNKSINAKNTSLMGKKKKHTSMSSLSPHFSLCFAHRSHMKTLIVNCEDTATANGRLLLHPSYPDLHAYETRHSGVVGRFRVSQRGGF